MAPSSALTFADLKCGQRATVVRIDEECLESRRLLEMGFTAGTVFDVIKVAPFGDPVEVKIRNTRFCLRKNECRCIEISLVLE
jgi:ferrous iron transport protein A